MKDIIASFAEEVRSGRIEIYNEFSLQHEFGIFLRALFFDRKVQFERNVTFFGLAKDDFEKREIDIVIFDEKNLQNPDVAIELKLSCFSNGYVIIFADDHNFYDGKSDRIYGYFRNGKTLTGTITKPTGKCNTSATICGSYTIKWHPVIDKLRYALIEAQ